MIIEGRRGSENQKFGPGATVRGVMPQDPFTPPLPPPLGAAVRRYTAYSTRLTSAADDGGVSSGRYRTSICALALPRAPPPAVEAPAPTPMPAPDAAS